MKAAAVIREGFTNFMVKNGHARIPSLSVIPTGYNLPGTYFVNSGVFQLKDLLISTRNEAPQVHKLKAMTSSRLTNCQRCIRVGGADCDMKAVGLDNVHHTMFEMLGSWSLGDYDIPEAIQMAVAFLHEWGVDSNQLHATYFNGGDGLSPDENAKEHLNLHKFRSVTGSSSNLWRLGKNGPCGTCVELYYELKSQGLVELWNIVRIQYAGNVNGKYIPLSETRRFDF